MTTQDCFLICHLYGYSWDRSRRQTTWLKSGKAHGNCYKKPAWAVGRRGKMKSDHPHKTSFCSRTSLMFLLSLLLKGSIHYLHTDKVTCQKQIRRLFLVFGWATTSNSFKGNSAIGLDLGPTEECFYLAYLFNMHFGLPVFHLCWIYALLGSLTYDYCDDCNLHFIYTHSGRRHSDVLTHCLQQNQVKSLEHLCCGKKKKHSQKEET